MAEVVIVFVPWNQGPQDLGQPSVFDGLPQAQQPVAPTPINFPNAVGSKLPNPSTTV